MKREERDAARTLRKKGLSMNEIAEKLSVSKASVSAWVRDIPLTSIQRRVLSKNGFSVQAIELRRERRLANTRERHRAAMNEAKAHISTLTRHELLLVGTALYWGEGGKTGRGMARLANSDPAIIRMTMRFFKEVCNVPLIKFRGHVHTFSHLNAKNAEAYWSEVSGIPRTQFFKTYSKPSVASKGKKDSTPYGTFQIYVCDTKVLLTIKGWIERLAELGLSR